VMTNSTVALRGNPLVNFSTLYQSKIIKRGRGLPW